MHKALISVHGGIREMESVALMIEYLQVTEEIDIRLVQSRRLTPRYTHSRH